MKFPWMRDELVEYLRTLSDLEYQRKAWVNLEQPPGNEDCFDLAVHFLYDDTDLSTNPQSWIGIILKNEEEALLVADVINAIENVFEDIGIEASDEEYINSSRWHRVLESSSHAYQVMRN
jgi:hypothetical protein